MYYVRENLQYQMNDLLCPLSGVVVTVLATGPKVREFEPSQGDGFLRVIKSTAHLSLDGK
jgi:hypothetical protein